MSIQPGGPVSAGKQSSSATESNVSLNQSNFATVDSVADGASATVRIYGSGGVGTSWSRISGTTSQVIPAGTILNVAYGSNQFVAWDGNQYQLVASLTQTFPDSWIPVGKVSVIANGSGLSAAHDQGGGRERRNCGLSDRQRAEMTLTAPPTITITDATEAARRRQRWSRREA